MSQQSSLGNRNHVNNNIQSEQQHVNSSGRSSYPDKNTSDAITLNDFYSSLHYSEQTLNEQQKQIYNIMERMNYCHQQAVKIAGDAKLGQVNIIEKLCSVNLLKGSECLKQFVSFNAEESPTRLNSSKAEYGQFYYNLMHCQDKDPETKMKYQQFMEEREEFSGLHTNPLKEVLPDVYNNLTLKNRDALKEVFSKVDSSSEDRALRLNDEIRKRFAQPQYENLRKCAKDRYFKRINENATEFGLRENNANELAHKCFVPYMEYFTRMGSILCRRQIQNCLGYGGKNDMKNESEDMQEGTTVFYLHSCMNEQEFVGQCLRYPEKYFIQSLDE
ncbi:hypothetical protein C9374_010796 [Naegleria lovaniensis]|uniref:Uncharacterized protein n=1 Tax=Naegleria lovaniensis TaxID=51637 RepID=A0AA88KJ38_NAELO|nr:uncharacterized protein C9374_010796 [Naegleria lovaniensis]KAG2374512.1 hypothetical protein C9374_010796 [Naegleria lovaniensis]